MRKHCTLTNKYVAFARSGVAAQALTKLAGILTNKGQCVMVNACGSGPNSGSAAACFGSNVRPV